MMRVNGSKREIPVKNYIFLGIIMIVSMFGVYYLYLWFQTYEESRLNAPIMDSYLQVINYNELSSYVLENETTVVYVSVVGNEEIREFENKFKNTVDQYSLKKDIVYMDITSNLEDSEISKNLSDKYDIDGDNVPYILVFDSGKLIDTYSIAKHNYSIKKIKKYLSSMGVIDND